jgi:hypothetical protein
MNPILQLDNIRNEVKNLQFRLRDSVVERALELKKMLDEGKSLPFPNMVFFNLGK